MVLKAATAAARAGAVSGPGASGRTAVAERSEAVWGRSTKSSHSSRFLMVGPARRLSAVIEEPEGQERGAGAALPCRVGREAPQLVVGRGPIISEAAGSNQALWVPSMAACGTGAMMPKPAAALLRPHQGAALSTCQDVSLWTL